MSLSKKTIALFLVLGISFCIGSYVALKLEILPAFEAFERKSAEESLQRVTRMLDADLRALEIMNMEYSLWDQTYAFANGQMPEYADENLDPAYWHSVNVHLMMLFDAQGNELYTYSSDPVDGTELSTREQLEFPLEPGLPLIAQQSITGSLKGLISTRSGVMQVASYPILTSTGAGPIAGTLVVGQLITVPRIKVLGERATTQLSLYPVSSAGMPSKLLDATGKLLDMSGTVRVDTDADSVSGYQVLTDIFGLPVAIVEVTAPRRITAIGANSIRTAMIGLIIGSSLFLLTALVFLQRLITAPIAHLTEHILRIKDSGDLSVEIRSDRSDEIGVLATEFGLVTRKLGDVQTDLEAARDEALAMSNAKSDFLARMSHEIRTPMNGVLGMTELLRETSLDDKQQRFAKTIYESGESLLAIINDILDISKIEAGKIELDIAPFDLQNLVEECLDLLAESAHNKGLELICDIPADTHIQVKGDPVRLRQVLMNLVGNAVKFTEQGQVIVRLEMLDSGTAEVNYRFEVEDTGVGISPENADLIFEPFTQEDGSFTRQYGGTGLGLSISKQLTELMGGEIGVRNAPGGGCTFWFTTKLTADQLPSADARPRLLTGKSVFIVDDNSTNLEILTHRLEAWSMQVQAASSGDAALELLGSTGDSRRFDIMLLDMAMPGMDGLQLAHAIRRIPMYTHVPIVMLSSISRQNVGHEQSTAGPDEWLAKPVRQSRLQDTLVSLLNRASAEQSADETAPIAADTDSNQAQTGMQVLLVDDNEVNLAVAQEMLNALGHRATLATNGSEAVAIFKDRAFDAVLMDCRMPGMDGFEATQAIRDWEGNQGRESTPIIALTAHALQGDRERCLEAGMSDYLSKPFTKQQLCSVLEGATAWDSVPKVVHQQDENLVLDVTDGAANDPIKRILIAEDNKVNQQVARAMLESLGYESDIADDGDAALAAIGNTHFDLVLMDCHMPVRDGYDTSIEIRRREEQSPQPGRVPIVALTADFLEGNRERCLNSGMDDYITKPFTQAKLQLVLDRWLSGADGQEASSAIIDFDGFTELGETISLGSINPQALEEIRRLDPSPDSLVLREIVVSYCASSAKLMLQLRAAITERDAKLVEDLAHCLKGGSGQLGATLLATICDEMIYSASHNDLQQIEAQFEMAATEHCAVLAGLDKTLQNLAA